MITERQVYLPKWSTAGTLKASSSSKWQVKPLDFITTHPVFRVEEFLAAYQRGTTRSRETAASALKRHTASGRLIHVRRGLYAQVPVGADPATFHVDPFLLASRAAPDAVIAYHAALEMHGKAHSVSSRITYLARRRARPFEFQGTTFVAVQDPSAIRIRRDRGGGIREDVRQGLAVRVTTHERTLVDVLDAPDLGGGWEEIWRSLESIEFFDLDAVIAYALRLGSALTIARVGYYLEQHRAPLFVEDRHLARLRARAPAQPSYFERQRRRGGRLVPQWNLIVPDEIRERSWEEVA
jgi:predicted transcriptional regulator of viral defense system